MRLLTTSCLQVACGFLCAEECETHLQAARVFLGAGADGAGRIRAGGTSAEASVDII